MTARSGPEPRHSSLGTEFDVVLEAAQSGACWGCTHIYELLAPAVAGYLQAQGAAEAEDLTSEVFLRVFSGCRSFSGSEAQFRAWVFTIAHSRLVDARRMKDRAPDVGVLEEECRDGKGPTTAAAEDEALDRLAVEEVHQLLDGLTSDQRDVLALRLVSQLSVEEVASVLAKPPGAIKALQRRALATLRRRLTPAAARR
ncbi:MAG: sigma-70 family RNA polymerase sigma factor [Acidimicrobiales bacterium]